MLVNVVHQFWFIFCPTTCDNYTLRMWAEKGDEKLRLMWRTCTCKHQNSFGTKIGSNYWHSPKFFPHHKHPVDRSWRAFGELGPRFNPNSWIPWLKGHSNRCSLLIAWGLVLGEGRSAPKRVHGSGFSADLNLLELFWSF